jgi:hypothetical protein
MAYQPSEQGGSDLQLEVESTLLFFPFNTGHLSSGHRAVPENQRFMMKRALLCLLIGHLDRLTV